MAYFSLSRTQSKWHTPWHISIHDLGSVMKREGDARAHSIFPSKLLLFPRSSATRSALWQRKERRENEADECKEALGGEGNASGTLNGARRGREKCCGRPGTSLNIRRSKTLLWCVQRFFSIWVFKSDNDWGVFIFNLKDATLLEKQHNASHYSNCYWRNVQHV